LATTRILSPDGVADQPPPHGVRGFELVHGRPRPVPVLPPDHERLRARVVRLLGDHLIERRLTGSIISDAGFVLGLRREPQHLRMADIAYVRREHIDRHLAPACAFRCVPELVVEISSAITHSPDTIQRMIDFLEAGVRVFWLLDPSTREALVYNSGQSGRNVRADEFLDGAPSLPALRIALSVLFPVH
jgi:Uma2 family endonuclease